MASQTEVASANLSSLMTSWKSIELSSEQTYTFTAEMKGFTPLKSRSTHYIETFEGKRYSDTRGQVSNGKVERFEGFDNGKRCTSIYYSADDCEKQARAVLSNSLFNEEQAKQRLEIKPFEYKYFFVNNEPLYKVILKATYQGEVRVGDYTCQRFLLAGIRWGSVPQDLTYYLDSKTSVPIKIESHCQTPRTPGAEYLCWRWEALEMRRLQSLVFPVKSEMRSFKLDRTTKEPKQDLVIKSEVKQLRFNVAFPDQRFNPVLQPGIDIIDVTARRRVGPGRPESSKSQMSGQPVSSGERQYETPTSVGTPLRAEVKDYTGALSMVGLGVGIGILVVGLGVKLRQGGKRGRPNR